MFRSLLLSPYLLLSLLLVAAVHGGDHDKDSISFSDGEEHVDMHSKSLILAKVRYLILVFVGTFVGGVSPYLLKSNESFLLLGTPFAAGLFAATAMMNFPMDAIKTFGDKMEEYPLPFMVHLAGGLLPSLADLAISYVYGKKDEEQSSLSNGDLEVSGSIVQGKDSNANGATHHHNAIFAVQLPRSSIVLMAALCFHSVFEGIAIGATETTPDAFKALWTIFPHNIFAAIAMSIVLLSRMPNRPLMSCVAYAFAFAMSCPIGVAIGITIDPTTQGMVMGLIFAISMGLARGMFIYLFVCYLLSKQYVSHNTVFVDTPYYKCLAMILGCCVIAVLMIWNAFGFPCTLCSY